MKNITNLTQKTIEKLQDIIKYEPKYRPRKRAEAILLSHKGKTVKEIVNILDIKKQALYEWFKKYEEDGVEGVYDKGGKGRKLSLGNIKIDDIKAIAINCPSVPIVNAKLREKFNVIVSNETVRTFLKNNRIELYKSKKSTTKETK